MVRTQTEIKKVVRDYVRALDHLIKVDRVVLYGSYAHGKPREWSDIDLAVVSRDFASRDRWDRQAILARAFQVNPKLRHEMIEPLGYSLAEYTRSHRLTFLGEIRRTGKVIYVRRKPRARTPRQHNSRQT